LSILIDANVLLYAKFTDFPQHDVARQWLDDRLCQPDPVGIPWVSLTAFARIATNRRIFDRPLTAEATAAQVKQWAGRRNVWFPSPGDRFTQLFTDLLIATQAIGNLVPDSYLAALALEHGLTIVSTDSDFARFHQVKWENPLAV